MSQTQVQRSIPSYSLLMFPMMWPIRCSKFTSLITSPANNAESLSFSRSLLLSDVRQKADFACSVWLFLNALAGETLLETNTDPEPVWRHQVAHASAVDWRSKHLRFIEVSSLGLDSAAISVLIGFEQTIWIPASSLFHIESNELFRSLRSTLHCDQIKREDEQKGDVTQLKSHTFSHKHMCKNWVCKKARDSDKRMVHAL